MRELRPGGPVVAAVVAVVEKRRPELGAGGGSSTGGLQSALEAFDVVADDVERTFAGCWGRWEEKKTGGGEGERRKEGEERSTSGSETDSESETTDSSGEHVVNEALSTIEEERNTGSAQSFRGAEDEDSSIEDESTLKGQNQLWSGNDSNISSTSDLSSSSGLSSSHNLKADSSTRCDSDFRWLRGESPAGATPRMETSTLPSGAKPPCGPHRIPRREKTAPGSLDRRRPGQGSLTQTRQERDQKARSSHVLRSPPRLDDFQQCTGWCCNPNTVPYDAGYCDSFHRRHESSEPVPGRLDPRRYGSSPTLADRGDHQPRRQQSRWSDRGSHPDIFDECAASNGCCPRGAWCAYRAPPPSCHCCYGERSHRWTPPPYPKPGEHDEKLRKIQYEKENLQLQVQVLGEQIEAQCDKISDMEKVLQEKKHLLSEAEEKLQKEMLARSSLETQKLELMSIMSELKLQAAALERENLELRSSQYNHSEIKKPPLIPRLPSQPQLTSTPVTHNINNQGHNIRMSPSPSPVGIAVNSPNKMENTTTIQHESQSPKTPPSSYKRQIDVRYGSLPRQQFLADGIAVAVDDGGPRAAAAPAVNGRRGVAFGRALPSLLLWGGRQRGQSVPNLAETNKIIEDTSNDAPGSPSLSFGKNNKGIKKIFGKMKRSGSGNLEDLPGIAEFQRGGVRATAAARLGWSEPQLTQKPDKPFAEWDSENVCDWLQDLGLDQYVPDAKKWVKTGQQLQEASINEVEKELNIKNPLHRKKLQLALIDTQENSSSDPYLTKAGKLDTAWVLRWLDDAGLPQHKENFLINRVDGRVLHRLTMDDLALLHVTSLLHVASIKRGIQVLRENDYEPACLQRRSLPEEPDIPTAKQISLWTTHRVMEWLRAVDLAEYAPNLRGAGVHGGLMVLEPRFTAELLAALLSIPPGKTLLRRHLSTRFKELLGHEVIKGKREAESTLGYVPLTPSAKLKVPKKAQFSLKRKKSKGEADYGDLVCPLNSERTSGDQNSGGFNAGTMRASHEEEDAYRHVENVRSLPTSVGNSPVLQRQV